VIYGGACCGTGIAEYPANSKNPTFVRYANNLGGGVAFDSAGNLIGSGKVDREYVDRILEANGEQTFDATPNNRMSFDAKDSMLYSTYGTVSILDFKTRQVVGTVRNIYDATGIAVSPATY